MLFPKGNITYRFNELFPAYHRYEDTTFYILYLAIKQIYTRNNSKEIDVNVALQLCSDAQHKR